MWQRLCSAQAIRAGGQRDASAARLAVRWTVKVASREFRRIARFRRSRWHQGNSGGSRGFARKRAVDWPASLEKLQDCEAGRRRSEVLERMSAQN